SLSVLVLGLRPQRGDVAPQLLPLLAFLLGQGGESLLFPQGTQPLFLLPLSQTLLNRLAGGPSAPLDNTRVSDQISPQPVEGFLTETGPFLLLEFAGVLSLARRGQGGGTGGLIAV